MALLHTPETEKGMPCPEFRLPGVDGKTYSLSDFDRHQPLLVMFICNHCPYVKAIEDRLIQLGRDFLKEKIQIVAICANDSAAYPEDSFEELKKRSKEKKYPFLYLHDETQQVSKTFGAVCTPDFFLYDSQLKLKYRGRLDDSWKSADLVTRRELFEAALCLRDGKPLPRETPSMGCSIKWKK